MPNMTKKQKEILQGFSNHAILVISGNDTKIGIVEDMRNKKFGWEFHYFERDNFRPIISMNEGKFDTKKEAKNNAKLILKTCKDVRKKLLKEFDNIMGWNNE